MNNEAGTFKIGWNWLIQRVDLEGNILSEEKIHNLVTNVGLNVIRDLLGGLNAQGPMLAIAIGTGATAPVNGNTALQTEYVRAAATVTSPADYQVRFAKTFSFGSGVSETITEAGILDNTVSGGKLLSRTTFTGQLVSSSVSLIITATYTISRV